jgi:hypothetical protein
MENLIPMLKHRAQRRFRPNEPVCSHQIDSYQS